MTVGAERRTTWVHPIFIDLSGQPVVVIGGGTIAERKVESLIGAGARVTVVSPEVTDRVDRWSAAGQLTLERRGYRNGDLHGARLAYATASDPQVNRAVQAEARELGIWFNAVDDPELCDFISPAVVRRGDLTIAISTNGRSPALARYIREEIEARFGPAYADAAARLGELRDRCKAEGRSPSEERAQMDAILTELGGARARREPAPARSSNGKVFLVGAGPGDPELLTVKGRRLLQAADTIVYDALVDPSLLDLSKPGASRIYVGKRDRHHTRPQSEINSLLIEQAQAGRTVVRLKGGDPFIFGRGGEEAEALRQAGIAYEVVPGVSAGVAVPAYAGIPLTHRDFTSELVFVTGHACGTAPVPVDWARHAKSSASLVIFMGLHNLAAIAKELLDHGRDPQCPVAVIENGTTAAQRTVVAPLASIADQAGRAGLAPPAIIVVGGVVSLREKLDWFVAPTPPDRPMDG
ncbi:MAG TPA: siroheme synthase CysG [Vicinamibacterales bacterium]|jgi:uroporphyrin-III C-methyltransferase/precorrin-2 dehydrogenase/sirohydrochlorin ferrochelatase